MFILKSRINHLIEKEKDKVKKEVTKILSKKLEERLNEINLHYKDFIADIKSKHKEVVDNKNKDIKTLKKNHKKVVRAFNLFYEDREYILNCFEHIKKEILKTGKKTYEQLGKVNELIRRCDISRSKDDRVAKLLGQDILSYKLLEKEDETENLT